MKLTGWMFEPIKDGEDISGHVVKALAAAAVLLIIILLLGIGIGLLLPPKPAIGARFLGEPESQYVLRALHQRAAGDCVVEPTSYGWKCTQKDGKVFKVRM